MHHLDTINDALALHLTVLNSEPSGPPNPNAAKNLVLAAERLHFGTTKMVILFGECPEPDKLQGSAEQMEQASAALVQAIHDFIVEAHAGVSLREDLIKTYTKANDGLKALIKALKNSEKIVPTMTAAVWGALEQLKLGQSNKESILKKLNALTPLFKDSFTELEEVLKEEEIDDGFGSVSDSFEVEFSNEDKVVLPACINLQQLAHMLATTFVIKFITASDTETPEKTAWFEDLTQRCCNLLVAVENLGADVYPPQNLEALRKNYDILKAQLLELVEALKLHKLTETMENLLPLIEAKIKAAVL